MQKTKFGIHWFRRDLRIAGNEALRANFQSHQGQVLGLFCFDSKFLGRADFSNNRFAFFIETLKALKAELQAQGGDLLVVDELPLSALGRLLEHFKKSEKFAFDTLSFNRDYEPFARQRDQKIEDLLKQNSCNLLTARDHLILEPHEVHKDDGSFYQVYSPFFRKWFENLKAPEFRARIDSQKKASDYYQRTQKSELQQIFKMQWSELELHEFPDQLEHFERENKKQVDVPIPKAGSLVAYQAMQNFLPIHKDYKATRDFPDIAGTSRLSIYFKNGSLVTSQVAAALPGLDANDNYLKELAWREFYYSILFHRPDVEQQSFLAQYRDMNWPNDKILFERWCEGRTGFPIVDAGMRQLNTTGWMHNRVRMIVASFLVKDLLIDWRWGEHYFMKKLLDGDLAPNNGGWQWAASTGCDPQPYFRIFNPWLQGERFDPEAKYIKAFIPELRHLPAKAIHDPDFDRSTKGYAQPIVEHAVQKEKALALFKSARGVST